MTNNKNKDVERVCYQSAILTGIVLAAEGTRITQQLEATVELPQDVQRDKKAWAQWKRERKAQKRLVKK